MSIEQDELQAKEFLKRVEIITMRKDLRKLREVDAIKERNKIVKGDSQSSPSISIPIKNGKEDLQKAKEKFEREKVLNKNYSEEIDAEKQLKNYANEDEKQRIFILESQKIELDKKAKEERMRQEPALVMKKNNLNLEKKEIEIKLHDLKAQEEKFEAEEKVISEKEKTTNVPQERESLEKRRQELENKIQEMEKKRWEIEREVSKKDQDIKVVDQDYQKMVQEENELRQRILEIDKQLRQIYSHIILRVQETKEKEKVEKETAKGEVAKTQALEKEKIQRQQWTRSPSVKYPEKEYLKSIPSTAKANLEKQAEDEEEHRRKFLENIEAKAKEEDKK